MSEFQGKNKILLKFKIFKCIEKNKNLSFNKLLKIFPSNINHSHLVEEKFDISKLYFTPKENEIKNALI